MPPVGAARRRRCWVAAGTAFAPRATLRRAAGDRAKARELPWPWVDVEMLVPVIAGGVERIVDALPRGALGFLKQNAHVPRSSGICVPRPRCLATAASSSSARLPGRITWTRSRSAAPEPIVVAATDRPRQSHPVPPPPARNLTRGRAGSRRVSSGRAHSAAARCCRGPRGAQDAVELPRADDQRPGQALGLPGHAGFGGGLEASMSICPGGEESMSRWHAR